MAGDADEEDVGGGFVFDRSEEIAADAVAVAERTAARVKASLLRGTSGRCTGVSGRTLLREALDASSVADEIADELAAEGEEIVVRRARVKKVKALEIVPEESESMWTASAWTVAKVDEDFVPEVIDDWEAAFASI